MLITDNHLNQKSQLNHCLDDLIAIIVYLINIAIKSTKFLNQISLRNCATNAPNTPQFFLVEILVINSFRLQPTCERKTEGLALCTLGYRLEWNNLLHEMIHESL